MPNKSLWKNRHFLRLTSALAADKLAWTMSTPVITLMILGLGASGTYLGVFNAAAICVTLVAAMAAGALADRLHPTRTIRVTSILCALLWMIGAVAFYFDWHALAVVSVVAIVGSAISTVEEPSEMIALGRIVPEEDLAAATGFNEGRTAAAGTVGGPLGGLVMSAAAFLALPILALAHLLCAVLMPRVPAGEKPPAGESPFATFRADVKRGYLRVLRDPVLRAFTVGASLSNLSLVPATTLLMLHYQRVGNAAWQLGILAAAFGIGVLAGSPFSGPLSSKFSLGRLYALGSAWFAVAMALVFVFHEHFWVTCVLVAISGMSLPSTNAAFFSYVIAAVPDGEVGSTFTASGVPGMILAPLGIAAGGTAFDVWGIVPLLATIVTISAVVALYAFLNPHLARMKKAEPDSSSTAPTGS